MKNVKDELNAAREEYLKLRYPGALAEVLQTKRDFRWPWWIATGAASAVVAIGIIPMSNEPGQTERPRLVEADAPRLPGIGSPHLSMATVLNVSLSGRAVLDSVTGRGFSLGRFPSLRWRSQRIDPLTPTNMENSS